MSNRIPATLGRGGAVTETVTTSNLPNVTISALWLEATSEKPRRRLVTLRSDVYRAIDTDSAALLEMGRTLTHSISRIMKGLACSRSSSLL